MIQYKQVDTKKSNIKFNQIQSSAVLLRVVFDLPNLKSTQRIETALESIFSLLAQENQVLITTHWGRPDGKDSTLSTQKLLAVFRQTLIKGLDGEFKAKYGNSTRIKQAVENLYFFDQYENDFQNLPKNKLILLENTRFEGAEQSKDQGDIYNLAMKYKSLATVFVDDAFAVSHRQEVTNYWMQYFLPWAFGLNYLGEIKALDKLKSYGRELVLIMGGAKLETKIPLVKALLPVAKTVVISGMLAPTFLHAKGIIERTNISIYPKNWVEKEFVGLAAEMLQKYPEKIILPVPYVVEDGQPLDLSTEAIDELDSVLESAKAVFWNGPLGQYENPDYAIGTIYMAEKLAGIKQLYTVIGGGDTVEVVPEKYKSQFDFISTGGGATLEYLSQTKF